jgi:2-polyprenyl-3-methyl-5-hydroxy-6-metoxy-1,4-benzoquinol methylase
LRRINRISLVAGRLWKDVAELAAGRDGKPLRVLDLGCGGGDVLVAVGVRARKSGVAVELHGCDVSAFALDEATRAAEEAGVTLRTHRRDVVRHGPPSGFDLVTASLFLHHLDHSQGVRLLRGMADAAALGVLVQDLRRTALGYGLAWVGVHTLTRSDVVRVDGLLSVRAALTSEEARALCREAGLEAATVRAAWPQRFVLSWRRS